MNNPTDIVTVTLTVSTSIYTAAFVLSDTQVVSNGLSGDFRSGIIQTVTVIDKDKQGAAFDIWLLDTNVSFGTVNQAVSMSAANSVNLMGKISVGTGDYTTFTNAKVAFISGLAVPVHAIETAGLLTRDFALAAINGSGTPTFTNASNLVLRLGILRDQHTN